MVIFQLDLGYIITIITILNCLLCYACPRNVLEALIPSGLCFECIILNLFAHIYSVNYLFLQKKKKNKGLFERFLFLS